MCVCGGGGVGDDEPCIHDCIVKYYAHLSDFVETEVQILQMLVCVEGFAKGNCSRHINILEQEETYSKGTTPHY